MRWLSPRMTKPRNRPPSLRNGGGVVARPPNSTYAGSSTGAGRSQRDSRPGITAPTPLMRAAASIPETTAASTQPPSIPLRVQSPARDRFSKPDSSEGRRCSTEPAVVRTYCSLGVTFARQYWASKREALLPAVQQGLIGEKEIDAAVQRLMLTRFRLGMFDPPQRVRWAQIPYSVNQSAAHDALARRAAQVAAKYGASAVKETDDPAKLTAREVALGEAIRQARSGAKPGDIFGTDLAPRIRSIIKKDWAKRSAADRRGLSEDIPSGTLADVNATYPSALPLATFPASLLAALPPLPEDLEYRFVGRHLILRDVKANIIVDVLPNVLPGART